MRRSGKELGRSVVVSLVGAAVVLAWLGLAAASWQEPVLQEPGLQEPTLQEPGLQEPTLHEEARVTAVDVMVELVEAEDGVPIEVLPRDLSPQKFSVLRDGGPVPLIATERSDTKTPEEPWHFLLYFDASVSSSHTLRWAAGALAERAEDLVQLGTVEVIVANPKAIQLQPPTRDLEELDQTLSGLFQNQDGSNRLVTLREDLLLERERRPELLAGVDWAPRLVEEERRIVVEGHDALLGEIVGGDVATPRRVLVLVTDGYDLDPGRFYGELAEGPVGDGDLTVPTEELTATLASYGWIVAPVHPAVPSAHDVYWGVRPVVQFGRGLLFSSRRLNTWLDKNRNAKKADAFHELGVALRAQGKLEDSAEAFRKAVYHYYDFPKTFDRQAQSLVQLAEVLRLQERKVEARGALRRATTLDPALTATVPFAGAKLLAPLETLERFAVRSSGRVVRNGEQLADFLDSLARRVRLTFQVEGTPDGELHTLEVGFGSDRLEAAAPRFVRSGTPRATAALRLRGLFEDAPRSGGLPLTAKVVEASSLGADARGATLRVALAPDGASGFAELGGARLRVSWSSYRARWDEAGFPLRGRVERVEHVLLPLHPTDQLVDWSYEIPLPVVGEGSEIGVIVEELQTGRWGSATVFR